MRLSDLHGEFLSTFPEVHYLVGGLCTGAVTGILAGVKLCLYIQEETQNHE